eukprot:3936393-Rhodomonas_salina.3
MNLYQEIWIFTSAVSISEKQNLNIYSGKSFSCPGPGIPTPTSGPVLVTQILLIPRTSYLGPALGLSLAIPRPLAPALAKYQTPYHPGHPSHHHHAI